MVLSRAICSFAALALGVILFSQHTDAVRTSCKDLPHVPVCCIHGGVYAKTKINLCLCHQYSGELLHEGECQGETTPPPEDPEPEVVVAEPTVTPVETVEVVFAEPTVAPVETVEDILPFATEESPALFESPPPFF